MNIDLNILNHLGLNLYSNTTAVLSEVIANAWDADATQVSITCSQESDEIVIVDNGNGMNLGDINSKYLCIGYQKRKNGEAITPKHNRLVMGRKGIGKLSLLSIADDISIYSKKGEERNAFCLSREDIERQIAESSAVYAPKEIEFVDFTNETGTRIVISNIKNNISRIPKTLRKNLARRFSVLSSDFTVFINDEELSIDDRDYYNKIQFLWPIEINTNEIAQQFTNISIKENIPGNIQNTEYTVSGWLATAEKPSDILGNNKISIITRGKLAQEDILKDFNEGGIYASYVIGEIYADFLDTDNEKDISTSSRQQFNEDDVRYKELKSYIYTVLKNIQKEWGALRTEKATEKVLSEYSAIKDWYDTLNPSTHKYAKKIFSTIDKMHSESKEVDKKELFKYGILAFERLRVSDKLSCLDDLDDIDLEKYGEIFGDLQDIESALYWDIANARVEVIRKLASICDDNSKERVIQEHIYDNLWLLNPSWERAASGTERFEQSVKREFQDLNSKLTAKEKSGRVDIRYKTTAGKHIIIELKRYNATYSLDIYDLMRQVDNYTSGLKKCLKAIGKESEPIEAICIIGKNVIPKEMTFYEAQEKVKASCRLIQYDQLIEESLSAYSDYLEKEKEIGKIKSIIEKL